MKKKINIGTSKKEINKVAQMGSEGARTRMPTVRRSERFMRDLPYDLVIIQD